MKTGMTLSLVAIAMAAALPAAADQAARPHTDRTLFERFDADGDGMLSAAEWDAMHAALRASRGKGWTEHPAKRAGMPQMSGSKAATPQTDNPRRAMMLERFDTDGDGTLSEEERRAARAAMKAWRDTRTMPSE